ncbi:hypothetical protein BGZ68_001779 [Mortierella alpina]|nr:hypothetical protein BGZ68_001779 [Mortierella alpina]
MVLRRLRIWLIFLSTVILFTVATEYILAVDYRRYSGVHLHWQDWTIIITTVIFFVAYVYSLKGKPFVNKFLRAFLLFVCAVLVLYLNLGVIAREARYLSGRFGCDSVLCVFYWLNAFLSTFFGFFALFEIALTLKTGPLQIQNQYGRYGYGDQANVLIVSPDHPEGYYLGAQQHPAMASHQQPLQHPQHQLIYATPAPAPENKSEAEELQIQRQS